MQGANHLSIPFLSAEGAARLVSRKGLAQCIEGMAEYIRADFLRWRQFRKSPRVASHSPDGVIELMPVSDGRLYAFKYVNGHPRNHRFGLPTVMAFGVLAEEDTGTPILVSELTLTTALRTAAMSAVAARALARPDSVCMALIGNGAQSEFQALAFHHLLGIREFRLYDTDPAATAKLLGNLQHLGLTGRPCADSRAAVRGADIVTTATADKARAAILTAAMVEPGMHLNAVGGDCPGKTELHPDVLGLGPVFCEFEPQSRLEGDMQQMPPDFPVVELWQVLAGLAPGRRQAADVTIFDSVGFALEDYSALRFLRDTALELGGTEEISLIPALADPKDLFGFLPAAVAVRPAPRAAVL